MQNPNILNYLKQSDTFYQFTPTQLELVANLCSERTLAEGEEIFHQNSRGKELYVIAQGEINIFIDTPLPTQDGTVVQGMFIATLRRGQSFGEVALVDEGLRSATAVCAQEDTLVLVIDREKLLKLCDAYPQLGYRLMYNLAADLATKIRNTDLRFREQFQKKTS